MEFKITVIVPIYNAEQYLEKCIDSIINQTYTNLEIILINDGSTDNSGAICDEYAKKDSRIKVIHKENGGQATARNVALDIATGDYIAFVDSDDYIDLEMYNTMYLAIQSTSAEIAMCGRYEVSADYTKKTAFFTMPNQEQWEENEIKKRFLTFNKLDASPCDKLFLRSLFEEEPKVRFPNGYICEDLPTIFTVLFKARALVHVGTPFYYYYQRPNSTSRGAISEKTYGLIKYPEQIREIVTQSYPEYIEEANFYYAFQIYNFMGRITPKSNKQECKKYRKELLKYKSVINKYADRIFKRNLVFIRLNIFYPLLTLQKLLMK